MNKAESLPSIVSVADLEDSRSFLIEVCCHVEALRVLAGTDLFGKH